MPVFTSDGLNQYFYASTAHFGQWVRIEGNRKPQWAASAALLYGQVEKFYRCRRVAHVEYRMQWGQLADLKARLKSLGLTGKLNTAFVERVNLTIRRAVAPLIRRTWGTAQTVLGLNAHVHWWQAYYHFVRPHQALRVELAQPLQRPGRQIPKRYRSRTPATLAPRVAQVWLLASLTTAGRW